jgi:hypothetical protein
MQYTLRSIPPKLDKELRKRAKTTGKSLNEVSIEALAKGVGLSSEKEVFADLDWFIGSKSITDNTFEQSQKWLEELPKDLDSSL